MTGNVIEIGRVKAEYEGREYVVKLFLDTKKVNILVRRFGIDWQGLFFDYRLLPYLIRLLQKALDELRQKGAEVGI
jgi:hypothetical protein